MIVMAMVMVLLGMVVVVGFGGGNDGIDCDNA